MCMYRERKRETRNSGRESKSQSFRRVSGSTNKRQEKTFKVMCFIDSKKIHSKRIFLTASHSRTYGHTSWRQTISSMLSHVRRECFFVITLPAVENKRSGAAEVAGRQVHTSPRHPIKGKDEQHHDASSRGFLSLGKPWGRERCESSIS